MRDQEGAVAVTVAISLVALFGIGALVLDVGNGYWERRQLQNGAEAAALAAAQEYTSGGTIADAEASAIEYANANNTRGAYIEPPDPADSHRLEWDLAASTVTAVTRTGEQDAPGVLSSWLAGLIGHDDYFARARATASWGMYGGGSTIPLTFSECEWDVYTGGLGVEALPTPEMTVYHHSGKSGVNSCIGPAGQDYPGGFGWLDEDGTGTCTADVVKGEVDGDTGSGTPVPASTTGCTAEFFAGLLGETVIMPIYTTITGTGSGATYQVVGFAALEVTGYRFSGNPAYNSAPAPCSGDDRCISGRFVAYYDLGAAPTMGGTDFGAYVIGLTG